MIATVPEPGRLVPVGPGVPVLLTHVKFRRKGRP
jgi:hypothetical protein